MAKDGFIFIHKDNIEILSTTNKIFNVPANTRCPFKGFVFHDIHFVNMPRSGDQTVIIKTKAESYPSRKNFSLFPDQNHETSMDPSTALLLFT